MTDLSHYDFALKMLIIEGVGVLLVIGIALTLVHFLLGPEEPLE